jgi:hypothetical protein
MYAVCKPTHGAKCAYVPLGVRRFELPILIVGEFIATVCNHSIMVLFRVSRMGSVHRRKPDMDHHT